MLDGGIAGVVIVQNDKQKQDILDSFREGQKQERSKFRKVLKELKKEMEQKWMETRGRGVSRIKCNAQLETVEHLIKYLEERDKE